METYILRIYRRSVTEPQAVHGTLEQVGVQGRAAFASSEQLWALLLTPARLGEYSSKRPGTDDADR